MVRFKREGDADIAPLLILISIRIIVGLDYTQVLRMIVVSVPIYLSIFPLLLSKAQYSCFPFSNKS